MIKHSNDPSLKTWVEIPADTDFPIQNLPLGMAVFVGSKQPEPVSIIGNQLIRLAELSRLELLKGLNMPARVIKTGVLNDIIGLGRPKLAAFRHRLSLCLRDEESEWQILAKENRALWLVPASQAKMVLPLRIGDYTDFYSSKEHATNVGIMFRDPANALLPNWLHLPVGYHGRSSSIVVSGTPITRPKGQIMAAGQTEPIFGPSQRMDFELEMAFVVGKSTDLGETIPIKKAKEHIVGLMLFNDWSARDIQQWEYVPLGPFLGKNFGSTVSPWLVLLDALSPFVEQAPVQDLKPLPYLREKDRTTYNIELEVALTTEAGVKTTIARSNFKHLYWTMAQQLTHHTCNGCPVQVGDLMASGTISGATPDSYGSMLELAWKGTKPLTLSDGTTRTFLMDGDSLTLHAHCQGKGYRIGFGPCTGTILPSTP
jgi:fumarylacetoacetase